MEHKCQENDGKGLATNTVSKDEDGEWLLYVQCGDAVIVINFCPFCGEYLK